MRLLALLVALALAAPAQARGRDPHRAATAEKVTSVEGITEYRLQNGLRVLLFPDPSKPAITVNITYLVGSKNESYGETGMAHLLEHLLFKPSKRFSGKDDQHPTPVQVLNRVGAQFNGSTWLDRTNYFVTFPASEENLASILDLEADRMVNANIDQKDLWDPVEKKGEMTVVRNEMEGGENNPVRITLQRTEAIAYEWHNYGKSTIGARSDVENVDIAHLRAFYQRHYQPDNAVLLVAGQIDEARALEMILQRFGKLEKPRRVLPRNYTVEPVQDGERSVVVRRPGDLQALVAAYHVPAGGDDASAALDLLSQVMADTPGGRLHKLLVDTRKAAQVFEQDHAGQDPGLLLFGVLMPKEASLEEAKGILLQTLEHVADQPITAEEVERARGQLLKEIDLTLNQSDRLAVVLSEYIALGDWRLFFLERDRLKQVKPEDVQRAAVRFLKADNRSLGIFVPTDKPDRAEIPAPVDVAKLVAGYQGGERVSAGEAFLATPANIDARTRTFQVEGLKVGVLAKKTRGQTVELAMTLRLGDESSLAGQWAAARIASQMLMRGTQKHSRQQIQDRLDQLHATLNVQLGIEAVGLRATTDAPHLAELLELLAEIVRQPAFDKAEFERLVSEQVTGFEAQRKQPQTLAMLALYSGIDPYPPGHPRHVVPLDERIALYKAAKVEEVAAFHQQFYGASGELAVVGECDPATLEQQLGKLFGGFKAPKPWTRIKSRLKEGAAPLDARIEAPDKAQAFLAAALNFPLQDQDPDYPALVLGDYLLGGGSINSRIANRLRQKEGLSYGAGSQFQADPWEPVAQFLVYASYAPENLPTLEAALREELKLALEKGFTAEEVAAARTSWLQGEQASRAQDAQLAGMLAGKLHLGRTFAFDAALEKRVEALTGDQVAEALRRHFDLARLSVSRAGDFAKALSQKKP